MQAPFLPKAQSAIPQNFPQPKIPNENIEPFKEEEYSSIDDLKNVNDSKFFDEIQDFLKFSYYGGRDNSAIICSSWACILLRSLIVYSVLPNTSISSDSKNYKTLLKNDKKRIENLSGNMKSILDLNLNLNLIQKNCSDKANIYINNNRFSLLESEYENKYNRIKDLKKIINDNLNMLFVFAPKIAKEESLGKYIKIFKIIFNESLESHENIFSIIFFNIIDSIKSFLKKIASIFITRNEEDQLIDLLSSKIKTALHMSRPYRAIPLEIVTERIRNRCSQGSSATVDPNALSIIPEPELVQGESSENLAVSTVEQSGDIVKVDLAEAREVDTFEEALAK